METAGLLLGIVASVFSISATIFSFLNYRNLKKIQNVGSGNKSHARGNDNIQVSGVDNRVINGQ